jgi:hypothetical protein
VSQNLTGRTEEVHQRRLCPTCTGLTSGYALRGVVDTHCGTPGSRDRDQGE